MHWILQDFKITVFNSNTFKMLASIILSLQMADVPHREYVTKNCEINSLLVITYHYRNVEQWRISTGAN